MQKAIKEKRTHIKSCTTIKGRFFKFDKERSKKIVIEAKLNPCESLYNMKEGERYI